MFQLLFFLFFGLLRVMFIIFCGFMMLVFVQTSASKLSQLSWADVEPYIEKHVKIGELEKRVEQLTQFAAEQTRKSEKSLLSRR